MEVETWKKINGYKEKNRFCMFCGHCRKVQSDDKDLYFCTIAENDCGQKVQVTKDATCIYFVRCDYEFTL